MLIVKKFEFEMAHCLDGHDRGCNNVHGHSYKLEVGMEVKSNNLIQEGSSEGMGVDFNDLKKLVQEVIIDDLDHSFIYNNTNKKECIIAKTLNKLGKKTIGFNGRTTCEMMSLCMLQRLNRYNDYITFIRLYETSGSYVEVTKKDLIDYEIGDYFNGR